MAGKEGLAAERVRALMLRLVEKLEAEVARFEAELPEEPAQRIKFITDVARAGRAIVVAEAGAIRAGQLVEGVGQRNPAGGAEDKDGDGMRDDDFSEEQRADIKARLEQKFLERAGLELKRRDRPAAPGAELATADSPLGSEAPKPAAG